MANPETREKALILGGPTAAGKTAAAIELAREFDAEIISADSVQVYRYMDIGSAKPDAEELAAASHHLVDIVDPDEDYNAGRFAGMATEIISQIIARGKRVIVCGGTGLYIRALVHGLCEAPPGDPELRSELKRLGEEKGLEYMYDRLRQSDPESAGRISENDASRIIRALEVFELTGRSLSQSQERHGFREKLYQTFSICLSPEREELYNRINSRVDKMIAAGLVEEVEKLFKMGYSRDLKSMQSLGYRQIAGYLHDELGLEEAALLIKRDTRHFAKRQFTWFRKDSEIHWTDDINEKALIERIRAFWEK